MCGPVDRAKPPLKRIDRTEIAIRVARAESLADAIARAHPDDARAVLTAALIDLHKGMPEASDFGSIREDARFWGHNAGEAELAEVCRACLDELPNRVLHLDHRKNLMAALRPTGAARLRAEQACLSDPQALPARRQARNRPRFRSFAPESLAQDR